MSNSRSTQHPLAIKLLASTLVYLASFNLLAQEQSPTLPDRSESRQFEEFDEPENQPESDDNHKQREGMTLARLTAIIENVGKNVEVNENGSITFTYDDAQLLAVVAEQANRMRIIAPVIAASDITENQMAAMLVSNYHLALDARYAVGDGVLYSAYVHPLRELTTNQVRSAIRQVATLRNTFGTSYSSGEMSFGIQQQQERTDI